VINKTKILYHVAGWSLFITYETIANLVLRGHLSSFADITVHYAMNITLFYLISHLLLPATFKSGKFKIHLFILYIIPALVVYPCLIFLFDLLLSDLHFEISWPINQPKLLITASVFRAIYLLGLSAGYWFAVRYFRSLQKNFELIRTQLAAKAQQLQLEKAVIRSENAFLQAQINPHLLFNTLNYIYNSVEEVSSNAAEAVMLLADISRYSMRPPDDEGMAFLSHELEQIQKLIRLNRLRFSGKIYIDYKLQGEFEGLKIAPLILLGFVENLFKHGDCSDSLNPAVIRVSRIDEMLLFSIKNRKSNRSRISHGIGLSNTKTRLDTLYGEKYELDIVNGEQDYNLNLSIKLDYAELLYS
jgi:sensor histidine kinase YesM